MQQLLNLSPILHVNEQESIDLTHEVDAEKATIQLFNRTGRAVIVTRGKNGAIAFDGGWHKVASFPATVKDTIGAGISRFGISSKGQKSCPILPLECVCSLVRLDAAKERQKADVESI